MKNNTPLESSTKSSLSPILFAEFVRLEHRSQNIKSMIALFLVIAALAAHVEAASVVVPLVPHRSSPGLYAAPVKFNHTLLGPWPLGREADFYIAQWLNPSPWDERNVHRVTPPSPMCQYKSTDGTDVNDAEWSVQNPNLRVCKLASSTTSMRVQLAQNGVDNLACGNEYDLFLSPNNNGTYCNVPRSNTLQIPLSSVTALSFNFSVHLLDASTRARCGPHVGNCGPSGAVDYGYITLGLPLGNPVAKQTIFFQILLFDTRPASCGLDPCVKKAPSWYFSTLPTLGVNYHMAYYTSQCLRAPGDKVALSLGSELLQTLRESISAAAAKFGADGNLSNWRVGDFYLGQGMQGSATMTANYEFSGF